MNLDPLDFRFDSHLIVAIRAWQHLLNEDLKAARFPVPVHLAFGYEGLAVALAGVMSGRDRVILPHRNVAYQLAFLRDVAPLAREFLGQANGVAGGLLGSMNLVAPCTPVSYTTSILGNGLPVASGVAMQTQLCGDNAATFVVIGDGAIEEGSFYETLVFAKSHGLSLCLIQENNDQSMSSSIAARRKTIFWDKICEAVDVPFFQARGMSFDDCATALAKARDASLSGKTPALVEVALYPYNQHAGVFKTLAKTKSFRFLMPSWQNQEILPQHEPSGCFPPPFPAGDRRSARPPLWREY